MLTKIQKNNNLSTNKEKDLLTIHEDKLPHLPNAPKKITVTVIGAITRSLRDLRR